MLHCCAAITARLHADAGTRALSTRHFAARHAVAATSKMIAAAILILALFVGIVCSLRCATLTSYSCRATAASIASQEPRTCAGSRWALAWPTAARADDLPSRDERRSTSCWRCSGRWPRFRRRDDFGGRRLTSKVSGVLDDKVSHEERDAGARLPGLNLTQHWVIRAVRREPASLGNILIQASTGTAAAVAALRHPRLPDGAVALPGGVSRELVQREL